MIRDDVDLARIRKENGLSQAQLAERVGVSQATISRLEKGDYEPTFQLLVKVARALDTELRELIPADTLQQALGQGAQEQFFAFCPNPLCSRNEILQEGEGYEREIFVKWRSGDFYAVDRFEEINFCTHCGTDLSKECPDCGRRLEDKWARFCISCGAEITDRPTQEDWSRIRKMFPVEDDDIPF